MKSIVLFLIIFFFSNYNSHDPYKDMLDIPACKLEMSKAELRKGLSGIDCNGVVLDQIQSFKIKFLGHPTQLIYGDKLNTKTSVYLRKMKIGNTIVIFDIKYKNKSDKTPMLIKIVE